jgi:hypothetical protein
MGRRPGQDTTGGKDIAALAHALTIDPSTVLAVARPVRALFAAHLPRAGASEILLPEGRANRRPLDFRFVPSGHCFLSVRLLIIGGRIREEE